MENAKTKMDNSYNIVISEKAGLINLAGLDKDNIDAVAGALEPCVIGYERIKDKGISEQKTMFRNMGSPYKELTSDKLMEEIQLFLAQGKKASEVFYAIKGWEKENEDKNPIIGTATIAPDEEIKEDAKIISINK